MSIDKIIREIKVLIRKHLGADYKLFLFGSWAKGNALPASDLDIGILGQEKIPWSTMTKILNEIENIKTLRSIEIVDFKTKSNSFRQAAMKQAKILV